MFSNYSNNIFSNYSKILSLTDVVNMVSNIPEYSEYINDIPEYSDSSDSGYIVENTNSSEYIIEPNLESYNSYSYLEDMDIEEEYTTYENAFDVNDTSFNINYYEYYLEDMEIES